MRYRQLTAALVAAGLALPAFAAPASSVDAATLEKLMARLDKLEARNAELEKQVKSLKNDNDEIAKGLDSDRISQYEPDLTARLKALETDVLDMKKPTKTVEALEGIQIGASLTTVAQKAYGMPHGVADGNSQLNYRADLTAEVPLDSIGDIDQKLFAHIRIGQGQGLNTTFSNLGHFAAATNSVAFQVSGANADDSVMLLGEAWYQASIPLPRGGFSPQSKEKLEVTFGKMDIFGFFDQNKVAGDESVQFLNSVFVHNPLLDAGGEVAVDGNGFQPGLVASYLNEADKTQPWRLSLGVYGAGDKGSNYQRTLSTPLVIAQVEKELRLFGGLAGNYRAYAWTRSKVNEFDGVRTAKHTGVGFSVDQRIGDGFDLFARYGKLLKGELAFDQALSLGTEISGNYWDRSADAIGIGASWLKASQAFKDAGGSGDIDGDGIADFTYTPSGAEKVAEIYYRYHISPQFQISPDIQWIKNAGANSDARTVTVVGLRANIAY
jgi:high affinity Mn2+ porin